MEEDWEETGVSGSKAKESAGSRGDPADLLGGLVHQRDLFPGRCWSWFKAFHPGAVDKGGDSSNAPDREAASGWLRPV